MAKMSGSVRPASRRAANSGALTAIGFWVTVAPRSPWRARWRGNGGQRPVVHSGEDRSTSGWRRHALAPSVALMAPYG
jgi:hypothetical protein